MCKLKHESKYVICLSMLKNNEEKMLLERQWLLLLCKWITDTDISDIFAMYID